MPYRFKICNSQLKLATEATPISLVFRETFICLLSISKRRLCRLRMLLLIIFIVLISSRLILVLSFVLFCFFLICPAEVRVHLIHSCVLYAVKCSNCFYIWQCVNKKTVNFRWNELFEIELFLHLTVCKQKKSVLS